MRRRRVGQKVEPLTVKRRNLAAVILIIILTLLGCNRGASPPAQTAEGPGPAQPDARSVQSSTVSPASGESTAKEASAQSAGAETPAATSPPTSEAGFPALGPPASLAPAAQSRSSANPIVQVDTNLGSFQIELDRQKAPITVENFLGYVERGQYDQTVVHQVFPNAVIIAGAFRTNGEPIKAGPPIFNEATNGLKNVRGTVAMYRDPGDPHSATSVFFINVKDNPNFDSRPQVGRLQARSLATIPAEEYGYCVFGRVIQGMDVVDKIAAVPVHDTDKLECTPIQPVIIRSIRWIK